MKPKRTDAFGLALAKWLDRHPRYGRWARGRSNDPRPRGGNKIRTRIDLAYRAIERMAKGLADRSCVEDPRVRAATDATLIHICQLPEEF